ncbi:sigma-70 family RNA polymerase sigma factor [Streptomyces sp. NPDC006624]|uniref:sigma-70 family RNA polymerase sigma factor n=1 Tax=unclassified Streptomyces TaxID=2593676 RepID=UPI0033A5DC0D
MTDRSAPPQAAVPPAPREAELVSRAKKGDTEAFACLYAVYRPQVHAYVRRRVTDGAAAEDFTSETFLRALRRLSTFTWSGTPFGAWLVVIARNLIADHYKSHRAQREVLVGDMLTDGEPLLGTPEEALIADQERKALWSAAARLNETQHRCLVLRFHLGLSVAETAEALGKPPGAVKTLTYRSVRALARSITDPGGAREAPTP